VDDGPTGQLIILGGVTRLDGAATDSRRSRAPGTGITGARMPGSRGPSVRCIGAVAGAAPDRALGARRVAT
jgi:hypothetical protein